MNTLLVVDVSSIASRAYHTDPYTYFSMVWKAIRDYSPTHLGLAFDDSLTDSSRKLIYPDYKGQRVRNEGREMFIRQLYTAYTEAGVPTFMSPEGDDMVASLVKRAKEDKFDQAIVFSGDHDMLGLVQSNGLDNSSVNKTSVSVLGFVRGQRFLFSTPQDVMDFLGVWPDQVLEYKALVGDKSDNVPGINGIGPVAAGKILAHGGIGPFLASHDQKNKAQARWAAKIREDYDLLNLYKRVLQMEDGLIPEELSMADLRVPGDDVLSSVVERMKKTEGVWRET